jgi:hypothetical protein
MNAVLDEARNAGEMPRDTDWFFGDAVQLLP